MLKERAAYANGRGHVYADLEILPAAGLNQALEAIGTSGYGKDASVGMGKFLVESLAPHPLPDQDQTDAWLTLAPPWPGLRPGTKLLPPSHPLRPRRQLGRAAGIAFKSPLLLAAAGAAFAPRPQAGAEHGARAVPFIGQGLGGDGSLSKVLQQTVHQGYAPVVGIKLPRGSRQAMTDIAIYQYQDGSIDVRMEHETVWLSLMQMTTLLGRDKSVVSRHIRNAFAEGELSPDSVVAKFAATAADGKTHQLEHYSLDAIISVGYRVKSPEGVRSWQWANRVLKDYLVRCHALDRRRLEADAQELEAALQLLRATLKSADLTSEASQGLADTGACTAKYPRFRAAERRRTRRFRCKGWRGCWRSSVRCRAVRRNRLRVGSGETGTHAGVALAAWRG